MSGAGYMEVDKPTSSRPCGAIFIEQHQDTLIQRVTCVEPILDKLLSMKVINDEEYQVIITKKTSQSQMRALLTGPMRSSGDSGKQELFNILKEQQLYMMKDLGLGINSDFN